MSLIQVTDVALQLDGTTDPQKQALIDQAEALVAGLIGRELVQSTDATGATVVPSDDVGLLSSGGPVTEDSNGDPDFDEADPANLSPLGAARQEIDEWVLIDTDMVLLPFGPVTKVESVNYTGDASFTFSNFRWNPWFVELQDRRLSFPQGARLTATVITGFTRPKLPDRMKNAIITAISLLRAKEEAAGTLAGSHTSASNPTVEQETVGPATFKYSRGGSSQSQSDSASNARSIGPTSVEDIIADMVSPWANATGI